MGSYKVGVYICNEENTIDFKVGSIVYPIGVAESVGVHLIPKYLTLLSNGIFYAINEEEQDTPRGVYQGEWEIESCFDLTKLVVQ